MHAVQRNNGEGKYRPDDLRLERNRDDQFGESVTVETPGMTHSFAVIDGTVYVPGYVDESVKRRLQDAGFDAEWQG